MQTGCQAPGRQGEHRLPPWEEQGARGGNQNLSITGAFSLAIESLTGHWDIAESGTRDNGALFFHGKVNLCMFSTFIPQLL